MKRFFLVAVLLLPFVLRGAETEEPKDWLQAADKALSAYQKTVKGWETQPPSAAKVGQLYHEILDFRKSADDCVTQTNLETQAIKEKTGALGESVKGEDPELAKLRKEVTNEQKQLDRRLAFCRLLGISALELQNTIQQQRHKSFSQELATRETPLWRAILDSLRAIGPAGVGLTPPRQEMQLDFDLNAAILGLSTMGVLMVLALGLRSWLLRLWELQKTDPAEATGFSLHLMYAARLPWVAGLMGLVVFLHLVGAKPLSAPLLAIAVALSLSPLLQLLVCSSKEQCSEGMPIRLLFTLVLLAATIHLIGVQNYLSEPHYLSLRGLILLLLPLLALWVFFRLLRRDDMGVLDSFRKPIILALLAGPLADWLGFRNLGDLLLLGVYGTATGAFLFWQLYRALSTALLKLEQGEGAAGRLRQRFGFAESEQIQGLVIVRRLVGLVLLAAFGNWLLRAWQVSPADTAVIYDILLNGFQVGAIKVIPIRLIAAAFAFMILWVFAKWLRRQMRERWLLNTRLDAGAQQSIVTLSSYAVTGIGALMMLSIMGVDFQNLAIVAGALSVGIGFGLQNIVNNFVSGLILLFERPVRPGDWVVVGATEGYVKKISIRYTLIQTFDRADVMVPNSELISHQVTNWMLRDSIGRVIVPVGVAYGSDTEKVKEVLLRLAYEHPMVIGKEHGVSPPRVLFMSFGESCMNFELRCFIRDVDNRATVRSDLLFAIVRAFRENGVEIPFPQTVCQAPKVHASG